MTTRQMTMPPSSGSDAPVGIASPTEPSADGLLEEAWGVIANVGHKLGGWDAQDPEWVAAAERWRDRWHARLGQGDAGVDRHRHRGGRPTGGRVMSACDCRSVTNEDGTTAPVRLPCPPPVAHTRHHPEDGIYVDACIAHVVAHLWENGVWTLSSCCGHGRKPPGVVLNDDRYDPARLRAVVAQVDDRPFEFWQWQLVRVHPPASDGPSLTPEEESAWIREWGPPGEYVDVLDRAAAKVADWLRVKRAAARIIGGEHE
jgi:hypothetical protein